MRGNRWTAPPPPLPRRLDRLGKYLEAHSGGKSGARYIQAGLTITNTLFSEPYLSSDFQHQGLLLHSVYHRPMAGTTSRPARRCPTTKARCGATTICANWP